jgi:hypothetical protein
MNRPPKESYELGMKCYEQGDSMAAIGHFRDVMHAGMSEYFLSASFNIACNLINMGRMEEGMELMKMTAQQDHPTAIYYMGVDFERKGDCRGLTCYVRAALLGSSNARKALEDLDVAIMLEGRTLENSTIRW